MYRPNTLSLYNAQKILFAVVLKYVVKKPPQAMYHWTASFAKQLKHVSTLPLGRQMYYAAWRPDAMLQGKLWNSPSLIRSVSSCPNLYSSLPFPGQGLKKNAVKVTKSKRMEKFVENRKRDQEWGKKYFPVFPELMNFMKAMLVAGSGFFVGWIFYPDFVDRNSAITDPTLKYNSAIQVTERKTSMVKFYTVFPWRALSRAWGRVHNHWEVPVSLRPYLFGLYSRVYNVNLDEAINPDLKSYSNFSEFFRRPIKSSLRPVDAFADLVSPADGRILHFGKVKNGEVEQVKGVTYSLQKFLGPLHMEPVHNEWGKKDEYKHNWCTVPLSSYMKAIMHNPEENDLYHCVIYLAPGDYHRFHSPADWIVQHRRHFPGDLLSVNPKIASIVPSLFVLNERVALLGKWKHGFFSMTAVGATNVGSVEIYGDITLKTNRPKRVYGGYYDMEYEDVPAGKGIGMGEFNLGSTIVLIFEAPKDFQYTIEANEKICYGNALQKVE